ncbi:MAG: hypothetical protein IJL30_09500 [Clostridia bacterium]|nr:hypothetical protein [Clostridia bacterium]
MKIYVSGSNSEGYMYTGLRPSYHQRSDIFDTNRKKAVIESLLFVGPSGDNGFD